MIKNLKFEYGLLDSSDLIKYIRKKTGIITVGRSNVGKSSLINSLSQSKVAHVSKNPGKTQTINFYSFNLDESEYFLIDTPGHGYANIAKSIQKDWKTSMDTLFEYASDYLLIWIQDAKNPWQFSDHLFFEYIKNFNLEYLLVFNKIDKLKQNDIVKLKKSYPHAIFVSTKQKKGIQSLESSILSFLV